MAQMWELGMLLLTLAATAFAKLKEYIPHVVWPTPPVLPVNRPTPTAVPIIQSLQNVELGKLLLTLAATAVAKLKEYIPHVVWPTPPVLPVTNPPTPTADPIIQSLQNLELGKLLLTLAATAAIGVSLSQRSDAASLSHQFIISGLMAAFMILWVGILNRNARLGTILETLGASLVLFFFYGLVATFLSTGFSLFCWVCCAFCFVPFVYVVIKPRAAVGA